MHRRVCAWFLVLGLVGTSVGTGCGGDDGGAVDGGDGGGDGGGDAGDGSIPTDSARPDTGPRPGCGDGVLRAGEACDDGNTTDGDGCSGDCAMVEPDYVCPMPGAACVLTVVCGDGVVEGSEACDDRNTAADDGCSADCSAVESGWVCETPGLPCRAAACGDGIIAGVEECDDGNPDAMDGCDATCVLEDGFACDTPAMPCRTTTCGDGMAEGTEQCDDMNNDLGDGCDPFCRREPMCTDGVCVAVCGDAIRLPTEACDDGNTRNGDGCSATCEVEMGFTCDDSGATEPESVAIPIVYRDFRGRDLSMGHPDFEYTTGNDRGMLENMLGADGKPVYAGSPTTPTTNGMAAWDEWYRDGARNVTLVERLTLDRTMPGTYVFDDGDFFPLDGRGWVAMGMEAPRTGGHNFHFTSELRYWFEYAGGENLSFRGDDDVWVFINGRQAIDIGGVHGAQSASVTLDAATATTLGLTVGGIYEAVVFQAERHTTQSSYRLTLRGFNATRSECDFECGDGIVTRFEICDDGVNDGAYGNCAPGCLGYGPRCGDAMLQSEEGEECDDGRNLGGYDMCNPGCVLGPRCGDSVIQSSFGEECDDGNRTPLDGCDEMCHLEII